MYRAEDKRKSLQTQNSAYQTSSLPALLHLPSNGTVDQMNQSNLSNTSKNSKKKGKGVVSPNHLTPSHTRKKDSVDRGEVDQNRSNLRPGSEAKHVPPFRSTTNEIEMLNRPASTLLNPHKPSLNRQNSSISNQQQKSQPILKDSRIIAKEEPIAPVKTEEVQQDMLKEIKE